jgi:hypothetical protein
MTVETFSSIATLARWHQQQGSALEHLLRGEATLKAHQAEAAFYRRMLSDRAAMDPDRLTLSHDLILDVPAVWCFRHGYRATITMNGVIAQRGGETPLVAQAGDTLSWDGERLAVHERSDRAA